MVDMSQYMGIFRDEAEEHLQNLNTNLLALEQNPENPDVISEIFRSIHTIKGMAATMDFGDITSLTHTIEDLFDLYRNNKMQVTTEAVDVLFTCFDILERMITRVTEQSDSDPIDYTKQAAELDAIKSGNAPSAAKASAVAESASESGAMLAASAVGSFSDEFNATELAVIIESFTMSMEVFKITVDLEKSCMLKAARAYMINRNLEDLGTIIKTIPATTDIEEENFERRLIFYLVTSDVAAEAKDAAESVSEVGSVELVVVDRDYLGEAYQQYQDIVLAQKTAPPKAAKKSAVLDAADRVAKQVQPGAEQAKEEAQKAKKDKIAVVHTVRVDINKLDNLMAYVGELLINKTRMTQIAIILGEKDLTETMGHMSRITCDLQDIVMSIRMVPIETVFNRFPRMVRDLARTLKKKVDLEVLGQDTELDRSVIDEIGDPLVHILRNCLDHGLELPADRLAAGKPEEGQVQLVARHEGSHVVIEVSDDGRGIDTAKITEKAIEKELITAEELELLSPMEQTALIFLPGFSTASEVSDISGRGVGLDVVRTKIKGLRGTVSIESKLGEGTKIIIHLPLTLAIIEALLIKLGEEVYAVPLSSINETITINTEEINIIQHQEVILLRGDVLSLARLHDVYQAPVASDAPVKSELSVVIVHQGEHKLGLVVDELVGQQEIVIKGLGGLIHDTQGVAGATILGDGRVALIVDVAALF